MQPVVTLLGFPSVTQGVGQIETHKELFLSLGAQSDTQTGQGPALIISRLKLLPFHMSVVIETDKGYPLPARGIEPPG